MNRKPEETKAMTKFVGAIEKQTLQNTYFRQVLFTARHSQLVVMCLRPGEEIGDEVHLNVDQFFRIEVGRGTVVIDGKRHPVEDDDAVIVPAGARHNVINTGGEPLKLYTLYGPPEHREGVVHVTKAAAVEEHLDGTTTE